MSNFIHSIALFFKERFNLNEDKADEQLIVASIHRGVPFRGANLWALIFAIIIASIGLNVNSTAVVIGAMLISPLMGPIMGVGLGVGTNDFELIKRGVKNLAIAATISIAVSALYFFVTPLHDINSELLARTNPSLWDVFIAFFGGLAGIVAGTRKTKGTVIPGVAISTALMPPLCTAGFGLATGRWFDLIGALYLFFINSLFICLATLLIVKHLGFHKKAFSSPAKEKAVTRSILALVIVTITPSIYLAYRIVDRSIFEGHAREFVQNEFQFKQTQVVNRNFKIEGSKKMVELLVVGRELTPVVIDSLRQRMPRYGLNKTQLVVRQGLDAKQEIDFTQIKASILEDIFKEQARDSSEAAPSRLEREIPDLTAELRALYPTLAQYSLSQNILYNLDSARRDTVSQFVGAFKKRLTAREREQLRTWLKHRIPSDSVWLVIQ